MRSVDSPLSLSLRREGDGAGVKETEGLRCTVQGSGRKDGGGVLLPFSVSSPFQALCGLWNAQHLFASEFFSYPNF
jgi:hypothetical protein